MMRLLKPFHTFTSESISKEKFSIPSKLDAADAEDGDESAQEDEAGDGEDGHLHGAEAAASLVLLGQCHLLHRQALQRVDDQLVAQFLAAHQSGGRGWSASQAVQSHLGELAGGGRRAHAAGAHLEAGECREAGREVGEAGLYYSLRLLHQQDDLQFRAHH
jgi:hypothetical protein